MIVINSLLDLQNDRVHVLDVVQVAENKRRLRIEAARDDVLRVLVGQLVALIKKKKKTKNS